MEAKSDAPFIIRPDSHRSLFARKGTCIAAAIHDGVWPPPSALKMCCRSCGAPLSLSPQTITPIPESFDSAKRTYTITDVLVHSPACAARYLIDRSSAVKSTALSLLHLFAVDVMGVDTVRAALPLNEMARYGGTVSDEEYVQTDALVTVCAARMVPSMVVNELRAGADVAQDACKLHWNTKGLRRPSHLPRTPAVATTKANTLIDALAAETHKRKRVKIAALDKG